MQRIWYDIQYKTPLAISGPEELEDLNFDVYSKASGYICAVRNGVIVAEYKSHPAHVMVNDVRFLLPFMVCLIEDVELADATRIRDMTEKYNIRLEM